MMAAARAFLRKRLPLAPEDKRAAAIVVIMDAD
jgi:hypothetical protein